MTDTATANTDILNPLRLRTLADEVEKLERMEEHRSTLPDAPVLTVNWVYGPAMEGYSELCSALAAEMTKRFNELCERALDAQRTAVAVAKIEALQNRRAIVYPDGTVKPGDPL
jgi:hypothetical protein